MFKNPKILFTLFLIILIGLTGLFFYQRSFQAKASKENIISLNNLVLEDMNGQPVALSKYQGKKLYIKLWASWCPICLDGLQHIDQLSADQNKDFQVITVVFPGQFHEKSPADFKTWFNSLPYKNTVVLFDLHGQLPKLLQLQGVPTNLFLNKELQIQSMLPGNLSNETIISTSAKLGDKPAELKLAPMEANKEQYNSTKVANANTSNLKVFIDPRKYHRLSTAELKQKLTKAEFEVTQYGATEQPFANKYFNNKEKGIYVDITTGEPLFSSTDKYHSGCGWPSFVKPIAPEVVTYNKDTRYGMERIEVRSRIGNCHLGHVFNDGPSERGGKRYCINSAALRFIPLKDMERAGYGYLIPIIH